MDLNCVGDGADRSAVQSVPVLWVSILGRWVGRIGSDLRRVQDGGPGGGASFRLLK